MIFPEKSDKTSTNSTNFQFFKNLGIVFGFRVWSLEVRIVLTFSGIESSISARSG